ncbi:MAG: hypothetical protein CMH54_05255 [Myxococcales bacterium]|nr:hypothetical protein [Myxococcales bacterium]|tara:strand:+ start:932 stop:2575 length:1644 start_codon:yes stop_codon:yes gene_type:complete
MKDNENKTRIRGSALTDSQETILARPEKGQSLEERIQEHFEDEQTRERVDPLVGSVLDERYEIEAQIGLGGMGAVYRAHQKGMDRKVAIKVLQPEYTKDPRVRRRFHIEALAASRLTHPHTIRIYDFGESVSEELYIVMEYLEGRSLQEMLAEESRLSVANTLRVARATAESLSEAHERGIVHRDLKPDNIHLITSGRETDFVKVLDFGVAKIMTEKNEGRAGTLTQAGSIFGTPRYMAPEQCRSLATDPRTDIYALGVIIYHCVIGAVPFDGDTALAIMMQHLQTDPMALATAAPTIQIPKSVEALILRCMHKNPDKRYQSADELVSAIDTILESLDSSYEEVVECEATTRGPVTQPVGSAANMTMGTGEHVEELGGRTRQWIPWVVLSVLLIGGISAYYFLSIAKIPGPRSSELGTVIEKISALSTPPAAISIRTTPAGATVSVDGSPAKARTPVIVRGQIGTMANIRVEMAGFEPAVLEEKFEADTNHEIQLKPLPVAPAPDLVPPTEPSTGGRKATKKTKRVKPYKPKKLDLLKRVGGDGGSP